MKWILESKFSFLIGSEWNYGPVNHIYKLAISNNSSVTRLNLISCDLSGPLSLLHISLFSIFIVIFLFVSIIDDISGVLVEQTHSVPKPLMFWGNFFVCDSECGIPISANSPVWSVFEDYRASCWDTYYYSITLISMN